jgi:uncharacterized protein (DUF2164 family)
LPKDERRQWLTGAMPWGLRGQTRRYTRYWERAVTNFVELRKDERAQAIASIQQYFEQNLTEPIGNLPAGQLLDFFMEEIGPVIYNRAISDAQVRLQQRVMDLNGELFADEFQFWIRKAAKRRTQK